MVHRIVIAVDDTPSAKVALDWTRHLLKERRDSGESVTATLLNVIDGKVHEGVECFGVRYDHEELGALRLFQSLLGPEDSEIETEVLAGQVAKTVMAAAEKHDADLIVVGTRHGGAVHQVLMGSVSQALAAERERPVAVIPAESTIGTDLTTVGYDGSPGSRAALRWALANCQGPIRAICAAETEAEAIDAHEKLLALVPALGHDAEGRVRGAVVTGDPVEALVNPGNDAPQIVMGARSLAASTSTIWGSTTTQVLAKTLNPVVVVPPGLWD